VAVVLTLLGAALVLGVPVALAARAWPVIDPASPRATSAVVRHELREHPGLQSFVRRRVDPAAATGFALTIAVTVVLVGASAVGVLLWMVRANAGVARVDRSVAMWGRDHATNLSTDVLKVVTDSGGTRTVLAVAIIVGIVEYIRIPARAIPLFLALVVVGQNALANGIKFVVDRARPDIGPLMHFSGSSFPSGHTTSAAACYLGFALLLGRRRSLPVQAALAGAGAAIAGAVAASRVLLGVHWLTDVLAGLALGAAWFAVCAIAFGGRLLRFGAPVEAAERVDALQH
jgi:undecaprenyl-diphosphatase